MNPSHLCPFNQDDVSFKYGKDSLPPSLILFPPFVLICGELSMSPPYFPTIVTSLSEGYHLIPSSIQNSTDKPERSKKKKKNPLQ